MYEKLSTYKHRLEETLSEYMNCSVSERTSEIVRNMIKCWIRVDELQKLVCTHDEKTLNTDTAKTWVSAMQNDDGTHGAHWTISQTTDVAKSLGVEFEHISEEDWWVTMNMMYSDYSAVAIKFGVNVPEFYAEMAKGFLFDKDAIVPAKKLGAYYYNIALPASK